MNSPILASRALLSAAVLCLAASQSSAQYWQATGSPAQWSSIACSADGTRLLGAQVYGSLYGSTNSGATWTSVVDPQGNGPWNSVACSADGTKWFVGGPFAIEGMVYSPASGWTSSDLNNAGFLVASSANGLRVLAAGGYNIGRYYWNDGGVVISTNSGVSWQVVLTNVFVTSLASSADGSALLAASTNKAIYISTNFGANWSTNVVDPQWSGPWNSVACSADGSSFFAVSDDGVFRSVNSGLAWTQIHVPDTFHSIAVSADATRITAAAKAGVIYTSANSGLTWDQSVLSGLSGFTNTSDIITAVAMSADGAKMYAAPNYGSIYTHQVPPALTVVPSLAGDQVTVSWSVSAYNFILQEAYDAAATTWLDVVATPSLDQSTQRYQVSVYVVSNPRAFFRLASYQTVQSTFKNLDFDSGIGFGGRVPFAEAFPSWTGYVGTNAATQTLFNSYYLDSAGIGLETNAPGSMDGKYYALLEAGFSIPYTGERLSSYLSQTGYIPANARSMQFKSNGGALVTLNGQALNPQNPTMSVGGNVFHADVTKFAGTTAELRFTVQPNPPPGLAIAIVSLDSIAFSTRPVP
jgi:hypothetical protein